MFRDVRFISLVVAGTLVALAIGFSLPALTVSSSTGVVGEDEAATALEENAFCEQNLDDINCRCFGRVAGYVRSDEQNQAFGFQYVDRVELARDQAREKC